MKLSLFVFVFFVSLTQLVSAQFVDSVDFAHFSLYRKDLGKVQYHIYRKDLNKKLPTVFFFQGSMRLPLIGINGPESFFYSFNREILQYADKFHLVFISKPGVFFKEQVNVDSSGNLILPFNPTYNKYNTQRWRVDAGDAVIKHYLSNNKTHTGSVVVIGYSEGGQVVPELAVKNKSITKLVSINGAALNQFYDGIISERMKAITFEQKVNAQRKIDSMMSVYQKIYKAPNALDKFHDDEAYKRWTSYTAVDALTYLTKLSIPILAIASGNDDNSPILGLDYIQIEFLRLRKNNLTYKVYPTCDHQFNEIVPNGEIQNKRKDVYAYIFDWLDK